MTIGSVITAMIETLQGNLHEIEHMLKVYGYAKAIGEEENLDVATQRILEIAAVVHDIGIPFAMEKYGNDAGPYQEELGPGAARPLLEKLGCDEVTIDRVCYLVGHHHTTNNVDGIDYRILLEADFLVNLYEDDEPPAARKRAYEVIFRTETGKQLCEQLYPEVLN